LQDNRGGHNNVGSIGPQPFCAIVLVARFAKISAQVDF
jgi:hypothetical protein